jgi:GMP synthase-like glutamine amidotransferase
MKISIGVFELGPVPEEVARQYPDYATMITNWLQPSLPEVNYVALSPIRGAPIPSAQQHDGYIYSGSRYGVYDDITWIEPLKDFIVAAADLKKPQFGICFGHQIIAEALGGKAVKSEKGWGCGMHRYELNLCGSDDSKQYSVLAMHQDQVVDIPADTVVIGGTKFCPFGVLQYAVPVRTVQFHPEFSNAYMLDLLRIRGGTIIPQTIATAAEKSVTGQADSLAIARWATAFFKSEFGNA